MKQLTVSKNAIPLNWPVGRKSMVKVAHTNKAFLRTVTMASCGIALFTFCTPNYAVAQSDVRERQFQRAVEQKQQYEAAEREKDRNLQLELERARTDRSLRADAGQYSNTISSSAGSQFYHESGGDAFGGTNAATYQLRYKWSGGLGEAHARGLPSCFR